MRNARGSIAVAVVALLLGFLAVAQLRGQETGNALANKSAQDLTLLVANLTTRNDQLRDEVGDLQRQVASLDAARARGETSASQVRSDLQRVRMWSGLDAVEGPGIRLIVRGEAPAQAISDLLNELRNAGAEAIAVGDVRVIPGTVVAGTPGSLGIDNTPLDDPVEIAALGHAASLTGNLTRSGGLVGLLQATWPDMTIEVVPENRISIPATERPLDPVNGKPRP